VVAFEVDAARQPQGAQRTQSRKSQDRVIGEEAKVHTDWQDLEGAVVDVEITDWPSATQQPRGRVIEILGEEDDFGVDVEIMALMFSKQHFADSAFLYTYNHFEH
jgi:ribonuclease R